MEPQVEITEKNKKNYGYWIFLIIVAIVALLFSIFNELGVFNRGADKTLPENATKTLPENYEQLFTEAIDRADATIIIELPLASDLPAVTAKDAEAIFAAAIISDVFNYGNRTIDYLIRILDSESPEFAPYKSIAAYFLLHSFYSSGGDVQFMAAAVEKSAFMRAIKFKAEASYPELFAIPFSQMTHAEKSLYFASHLLVLSDRPDSIAIPGNASLELSRALAQMNRFPDSALYRITSVGEVEEKLRTQLQIVSSRIDKLNLPQNTTYTEVQAYDIVTGLNNYSSAIDLLRQFSQVEKFPELSAVDTTSNYAISADLASRYAPSLFQFTNYLHLRNIVNNPTNSVEETEKVEELVANLIGVSPYPNINSNSWVFRVLSRLGQGDPIYYTYLRQDIGLIAERSPNMRNFLVTFNIISY